jgi:hypothetical protein
MANALGEEGKKRSKTDFVLLLAASLFVAITGTAAFWMADEHSVNPTWLFAAGAAVLFFLVVGWGYRRKFRDPSFVSFFLAWLLVHVAVYLFVLIYRFPLLPPSRRARTVDRLYHRNLAVRPSAGSGCPVTFVGLPPSASR